ncbi:hypothetical protein BC940DRAFT_310152 [Gongronella butleri]|nr:hypothetical protein BC940DRAFT_310152 [Gongronella butleri]
MIACILRCLLSLSHPASLSLLGSTLAKSTTRHSFPPSEADAYWMPFFLSFLPRPQSFFALDTAPIDKFYIMRAGQADGKGKNQKETLENRVGESSVRREKSACGRQIEPIDRWWPVFRFAFSSVSLGHAHHGSHMTREKNRSRGRGEKKGERRGPR